MNFLVVNFLEGWTECVRDFETDLNYFIERGLTSRMGFQKGAKELPITAKFSYMCHPAYLIV